MIKFFRKIRQKLLSENKFSKYLIYAMGEIVLVVIGILIALSLNNWNEERKDQNKLVNVYRLIDNDIKNDIEDLQRIVDFYSEKKSVFEKVVNDSISPDLIDKGLSRLLDSHPHIVLNKKGVSQLKELQINDTLAFFLDDIYEWMDTRMLSLENSISAEMLDHEKYLRDHYEWYPEWRTNTIAQDLSNKELNDYFLSDPTYRNRVTFTYSLIKRYTGMLNALIRNLTEFQEQVDEVIKEADDKIL
jgi:hypothetical protein